MNLLKITSCQAPSMDNTCRAIVAYIGERLHPLVQTEFIDDSRWQERFRQLDAGQIQMAWICGSHYVRRRERVEPTLELLAAPVWQGDRYQGLPVYFSDVVVRHDSRFHTFSDLRGATWAYNEPGSLSGYDVMRYHLAQQGRPADFFGKVVESGAHQHSLQMIVQRQADVSAIDSTVLEQALRTQPELAQQIRVIDSIGPSPMPPWVITLKVSPEIRTAVRLVLTSMHEAAAGRAILEQGAIVRFMSVVDTDYDPVRTILRTAATLSVRQMDE